MCLLKKPDWVEIKSKLQVGGLVSLPVFVKMPASGPSDHRRLHRKFFLRLRFVGRAPPLEDRSGLLPPNGHLWRRSHQIHSGKHWNKIMDTKRFKPKVSFQ